MLAGAVKMFPTEFEQTAVAPLIEQVGSGLTVKVAGIEFDTAQVLLNCARYCLLLSARAVTKVSVMLLAPEILSKLTPLLVLTCHCTVGAGLPVAVE